MDEAGQGSGEEWAEGGRGVKSEWGSIGRANHLVCQRHRKTESAQAFSSVMAVSQTSGPLILTSAMIKTSGSTQVYRHFP